jgi:hypothetical protein
VPLRHVLPRIGKAALPWALEALLIVFSVALGFWVSQLQQSRGDRELKARVLASLQQELEHNAAVLEPYVAMHRTWTEAMTKAATEPGDRAAFDVFFARRPTLPPGANTPFPSLRRSAWDAALSGGAIRLVDHDVAENLSDVYRRQELVEANVQRLANGVLGAASTFDPASRTASVRLLWLTLADIQSAEAILLQAYRQHLPAMRAAAGLQR